MYVADLEKALRLFGPRLYQLYGQGESPMTITGLTSGMHADTAHPNWRDRLGSCGVPRTGVLVKVVDENDRELPPGEIGEVVTRERLRHGRLLAEPGGQCRNPARRLAAYRRSRQHGRGRVSDPARPLEGHDHLAAAATSTRARSRRCCCATPTWSRPRWSAGRIPIGARRSSPLSSRSPAPRSPSAALDRLCLDHIARFKRPREYRFVEALPKNNYGKVLKTELRRLL